MTFTTKSDGDVVAAAEWNALTGATAIPRNAAYGSYYALRDGTFYLPPTGDATGVQDLANVNAIRVAESFATIRLDGAYYFSDTIIVAKTATQQISIVGTGPDRTTLTLVAAGKTLIANDGTHIGGTGNESWRGGTLRGVQLKGNGNAAQVGLRIQNAERIILDDVYFDTTLETMAVIGADTGQDGQVVGLTATNLDFRDATAYGLRLRNVQESSWTRVQIIGANAAAIGLDVGDGASQIPYMATFMNCHVGGIGAAGVYLNGGYPLVFHGCHIEGTYTIGLQQTVNGSDGTLFIACRFETGPTALFSLNTNGANFVACFRGDTVKWFTNGNKLQWNGEKLYLDNAATYLQKRDGLLYIGRDGVGDTVTIDDSSGDITLRHGLFQTAANQRARIVTDAAKAYFQSDLDVVFSSIGSATPITTLQKDGTMRLTSQLVTANLTQAQRDALVAPDGAVIYNTTAAKLQVRSAGAWADLH